MRTSSVPRRTVLKLGAAVITCSLLASSSHANDDDPAPSPARPWRTSLAPMVALAADSLTQGVWLWQRTSYADGTTIPCSDPSKYTLAFLDTGIYSVQADCNQGSGAYTVDGSRLTLQPGPMTRAACPPGSQDTVFLKDLGRVSTYVFDGDNLVLNLELDSGNMVFSPRPQVSLTGSPWQVVGVNNGHEAVASVVSGTQLDATFGEDGIVSGSTGCNTYRGLYTVAGVAIAFGSLLSTRRPCPSDAATAQEQAFLAALGASTRYELRGDRLTLRNDAGATQVDLVRPPG
jgi:heat shock protein HslJ